MIKNAMAILAIFVLIFSASAVCAADTGIDMNAGILGIDHAVDVNGTALNNMTNSTNSTNVTQAIGAAPIGINGTQTQVNGTNTTQGPGAAHGDVNGTQTHVNGTNATKNITQKTVVAPAHKVVDNTNHTATTNKTVNATVGHNTLQNQTTGNPILQFLAISVVLGSCLILRRR